MAQWLGGGTGLRSRGATQEKEEERGEAVQGRRQSHPGLGGHEKCSEVPVRIRQATGWVQKSFSFGRKSGEWLFDLRQVTSPISASIVRSLVWLPGDSVVAKCLAQSRHPIMSSRLGIIAAC